jgi:hypothetical protein
MSLLDLHDTAHDMYLPDKRAKKHVAPNRATALVIPNPHGTHEQKEAWMRQRQRLKAERHENSLVCQLARQLKPVLFPVEPCQCTVEQIQARIKADPELRQTFQTPDTEKGVK